MLLTLTEKEFNHVIRPLESKRTSFNRDFSPLQNAIPGLPLIEFKVREFVTKNGFYRPSNSELINSSPDQSILAYSMHYTKSVLILKRTASGDFMHSIYTTEAEQGFYLSEIYQLMVISEI